ncbi:hypothetical protein Tco_0064635 [Tanacetum coccineum]
MDSPNDAEDVETLCGNYASMRVFLNGKSWTIKSNRHTKHGNTRVMENESFHTEKLIYYIYAKPGGASHEVGHGGSEITDSAIGKTWTLVNGHSNGISIYPRKSLVRLKRRRSPSVENGFLILDRVSLGFSLYRSKVSRRPDHEVHSVRKAHKASSRFIRQEHDFLPVLSSIRFKHALHLPCPLVVGDMRWKRRCTTSWGILEDVLKDDLQQYFQASFFVSNINVNFCGAIRSTANESCLSIFLAKRYLMGRVVVYTMLWNMTDMNEISHKAYTKKTGTNCEVVAQHAHQFKGQESGCPPQDPDKVGNFSELKTSSEQETNLLLRVKEKITLSRQGVRFWREASRNNRIKNMERDCQLANHVECDGFLANTTGTRGGSGSKSPTTKVSWEIRTFPTHLDGVFRNTDWFSVERSASSKRHELGFSSGRARSFQNRIMAFSYSRTKIANAVHVVNPRATLGSGGFCSEMNLNKGDGRFLTLVLHVSQHASLAIVTYLSKFCGRTNRLICMCFVSEERSCEYCSFLDLKLVLTICLEDSERDGKPGGRI